ncbi:methyltransferase [Spirillospora sp. NPDC029432]|uniref:methyltransferase n=1 Tax=Spirillospora sp. NPDC029432 TaxID=3154599 RepID=UPI00345686D8
MSDSRMPSEAAVEMMNLLGGFMISQGLFAAARLGVADELVDGPRPVGEVAAAVGARPEPLRRLLRTLAVHGVFRLDGDEAALGPLGGTLASGTPESLRNMALMWMETHYAPFGDLHRTLVDGRPAVEHHHGVPFFEWLGRAPERTALFSAAMSDALRALRMGALDGIDLSWAATVVDVGGADGAVLAELAARYPRLRGTVFDLPEVAASAAERLAAAGVADRVGAVGGDFFESVPAGADAYLACLILHDWDDERASRILRGVHAAAPAGARLILMDVVLPERDVPPAAALLDLTMMGILGGRERTEEDWRALLGGAGFALDRVLRPPGPCAVLETTRV